MAILGSATLGSKCPVCGARNHGCGGHGSDDGIKIRRPARRGQPLRNYRVGATVLRLNDDHARARGLLPEEAPAPTVDTPAPNLDAPPVDGRIGEMLAWAGETDPDRIHAAIEAEHAARARPTLIAALERLLEEL